MTGTSDSYKGIAKIDDATGRPVVLALTFPVIRHGLPSALDSLDQPPEDFAD
jgi:hypothetical protein